MIFILFYAFFCVVRNPPGRRHERLLQMPEPLSRADEGAGDRERCSLQVPAGGEKAKSVCLMRASMI